MAVLAVYSFWSLSSPVASTHACARSEREMPKYTRSQLHGLTMCGAIAARSRSLEGGNGNRQRSTAQTHGLQQLARDKALSGVTVLLRPIPNARPRVCRYRLRQFTTRAEPYRLGGCSRYMINNRNRPQ